MRSFKHVNARTVDEACALLADYEGKAILNAGGTELLSILKGEYLSIILKPSLISRPYRVSMRSRRREEY